MSRLANHDDDLPRLRLLRSWHRQQIERFETLNDIERAATHARAVYAIQRRINDIREGRA